MVKKKRGIALMKLDLLDLKKGQGQRLKGEMRLEKKLDRLMCMMQ